METTTSDYDREKLQERLAKLSGEREGGQGWGCLKVFEGDFWILGRWFGRFAARCAQNLHVMLYTTPPDMLCSALPASDTETS
jgi:hypothetical protein